MIIDLILDRKDGDPYDPKHFYTEMSMPMYISESMQQTTIILKDFLWKKKEVHSIRAYRKFWMISGFWKIVALP